MPGSQGVGRSLRRLTTGDPPLDAQEVVDAHHAKEAEDGGLQGDTGDDDAVAREQQLRLVVPGGRGEAAADGLQDQARDVGGDEDERVQARADAREGRVEGQGDVL